ncbi:MAG: hypothetical protein FWG30_00300 [Eubacteriaceae bacterium]|nr:hypothetical protein [Eubacteriaceae bacterium]
MNKKKALAAILFAAVAISLPLQTVHADMGPKPSIKIVCTNVPNGEVYLDLLIEQPPFPEGKGFGIDDFSPYNSQMAGILVEYSDGGWRPALATGTSMPLFGNLRLSASNGTAVSSFSYFGTPAVFKIIAVTDTLQVSVSNVIERQAYQATVYFDFETGIAKERNPLISSAVAFAVSLIATLVLEGLVLMLFRFSLRLCIKPFIAVNVLTQTLLHGALAWVTYNLGAGTAIFAYAFLEVIIIVAEAVLFMLLLRQHTKLRRAMYAIVANIVSFVSGLVILAIMAVVS